MAILSLGRVGRSEVVRLLVAISCSKVSYKARVLVYSI